jgi:hypothetical protein
MVSSSPIKLSCSFEHPAQISFFMRDLSRAGADTTFLLLFGTCDLGGPHSMLIP